MSDFSSARIIANAAAVVQTSGPSQIRKASFAATCARLVQMHVYLHTVPHGSPGFHGYTTSSCVSSVMATCRMPRLSCSHAVRCWLALCRWILSFWVPLPITRSLYGFVATFRLQGCLSAASMRVHGVCRRSCREESRFLARCSVLTFEIDSTSSSRSPISFRSPPGPAQAQAAQWATTRAN